MIVLSIEKKQFQRFLLLIFVIWCFIPTVIPFASVSNELMDFVLLYTIAGYLRIYGIKWKLRSRHYFAIWFLASVITFASSVAFMVLGKQIPAFGGNTLFFYSRQSILTIVRAVCFFLAFERMESRYSKIINIIASATFGVYLIHDNPIIRQWLWGEVINCNKNQNSLIIIPYSIISALIVYVACTGIDLVRSRIGEPIFAKIYSVVHKKKYHFN